MSRKRFAKLALLIAILPFALGAAFGWVNEQISTAGVKTEKPKATATPAPVSSATANPFSKNQPNSKASVKPGRQYEVQPGDTISSIGQANEIEYLELAKYNGIPYPYNLTVGQTIVIPEK